MAARVHKRKNTKRIKGIGGTETWKRVILSEE